MKLIEAFKKDWKRLTTKEGWAQIREQAEGKKKTPEPQVKKTIEVERVLMYRNEPIVAINPANPEYKLSGVYHQDIMVPRWKEYRKQIAPLDAETMEDELLPEVEEKRKYYGNIAVNGETSLEREKATIEEVFYIGCQTVLETEIEEWTEELRFKKMKYYNLI